MYSYILNNEKDLIYNDSLQFKGAVEVVSPDNIDSETGGFKSRSIIIRTFDNDNTKQIELNNKIKYNAEVYIISEMLFDNDSNGEYVTIICYEEVTQDAPITIDMIRSKIIEFVESTLGNTGVILTDKMSLKTQEDYKELGYPRFIFDLNKSENISLTKTKLFDDDDNVTEESRYNNIWDLVIEYFGSSQAYYELEEVFQDSEEIEIKSLSFLETNTEFKNLTIDDFTTILDQNSYQNNQPRLRKIYSIRFKISYVKVTKEIGKVNSINIQGGLYGATIN